MLKLSKPGLNIRRTPKIPKHNELHYKVPKHPGLRGGARGGRGEARPEGAEVAGAHRGADKNPQKNHKTP